MAAVLILAVTAPAVAAAAAITTAPIETVGYVFTSALGAWDTPEPQVAQSPDRLDAQPTYKQLAPLPAPDPEPVLAAAAAPRVRRATAAAPKSASRVSAASQPSATSASSGQTDLARAQSILAGLIRKHPILKGTTVTIGKTPGGYQAVAYYKSGRIVISPNHRSSLERLLNHEIWHVIDWRDNGRIDWYENVPPR